MILLTGATGFVGSELLRRLDCNRVIVLGRTPPKEKVAKFVCGDLHTTSDFSESLAGVTTIIHCAARVHVMNDTSSDPLGDYMQVNCVGTLNLAAQAARSGVKRFIFISTVKVLGEASIIGKPFNVSTPYAPEDYYAESKAEAERQLFKLAADTGLEVVIIRPPLVYGPGVKANFAAMLSLAKRNLPLPLSGIDNKRSLVFIDNLVDLMVISIDHPAAKNQVFLVSDGQDLSTGELLSHMTHAYGLEPRLFSVPTGVLRFVGACIGRKAVLARLCSSLQVDIEHTKTTLGWYPKVTVQDGIRRCLMS